MTRTRLIPTLAAGALALASVAAHAVGTLAITPATKTVQSGDSFIVELRGTGFDEDTLGGGASLAWNPDVIDLTSVAINPADWEFSRFTGLLDPASGTLSDLYAVTFATPRQGDFLIATLTFTADGPGVTALSVGASVGQPFANLDAAAIELTFSPAQITVTAVPEPGTWALMAAGLAGLPWLRRRQRRAEG